MDLLGSILNSMDAPPKTEDSKAREKRAKLAKLQKEERKKKADFREKVEKDVNKFINDAKRTRLKFPPMNKVQRSIVHDVAEIGGLTTFSFGEDEVDRYVMLFKKESPPPDEELEAYRNGEEYDPEVAKKKKKAQVSSLQTSEESATNMFASGAPYWPASKAPKGPGTSAGTFYKDKYKHLLGESSGKAAATTTKSNTSYGVVPSENKRDLRSIEETLNDIRKRKRHRPNEDGEGQPEDPGQK
ncbi:sperm-associated antigen 7 homolog [Nematostella vectensis]|uniref:sperm-associated antigen 7 homolog n=1 Tax=Nematostella vectensis TaxID=45351 RepID=UPI00207790BC|nr:sperm-associated antigen 7 homolog [Nematostella vectensis]